MTRTTTNIVTGEVIPFTPEEEAERDAEELEAAIEVQALAAKQARLDEIHASPEALDIFTRAQTATNAEIDAFIQNASAEQLRKVIAGMFKFMLKHRS